MVGGNFAKSGMTTMSNIIDSFRRTGKALNKAKNIEERNVNSIQDKLS